MKEFKDWWFHGYLSDPPTPETLVDLPAGGLTMTQIACNKSYTVFPGNTPPKPTTFSNGWVDDACPGDVGTYHAGGGGTYGGGAIDPMKVTGCALAIADQSDVTKIQPTDFVVFSTNMTCVYHRDTAFQVPPTMPACSDPNGCICAWFWQGFDSQAEMYMIGFRCQVTQVGTIAPPQTLAKPKAAVLCGGGRGTCTKGAKMPMFWANLGYANVATPTNLTLKPEYNDLYGFHTNGAQTDIFVPTCPKRNLVLRHLLRRSRLKGFNREF